jgi:ADP-heptose:LPS heptosyltransferase
MRPDRLLLIRNDKLGDFMLAWPAFALLRQQYPDATLVALVPHYTAPMAELCPSIDEIIIDDQHQSEVSDAIHLGGIIRAADIDISVSFFSELRTALALWLARVPTRVAPATKLAQLFHNRTLRQKRSLSAKPEFEYNIDLARYAIELHGNTPKPCPQPPYLELEISTIDGLRSRYCAENSIDPDKMLVFIHAGSGGSAINLSLEQFASIARFISDAVDAHIVLTAGPDELENATRLATMLPNASYSIYHSTEGLVSFTRFIGICDAFISGSTGPLHIAGALNKPTIAFYPARRSATSLRWQTLSEDDRRLAFMSERYSGESDSLDINVDECNAAIAGFLRRQGSVV